MRTHLLRIDGSARKTDSVTRTLSDELIDALAPDQTTVRDLADGIALISEKWVSANFTPEEQRTEAQKLELAGSDALVAELQAADTIVIGLPAYNFSVPASVKAWIDMVARARLTFNYTENGPEGLLKGKRAYIIFASGGTPVGSDYDFATSYLKHALAFIGITDVKIISADQLGSNGDDALSAARHQIAAAVTDATSVTAAA
jgi:FMN-dependent NADH-azoreductase